MRDRSVASQGSRSVGFATAVLAVVAALVTGPQVHAFPGSLDAFNAAYPASSSGANAGCQLCHGANTANWNEYGWGLLQNGSNFPALEPLPSVNINGGTTMLDEINASTQPGWTTGSNNNLYDRGGLISSTATAPAGISGDLDPTANVSPTADPNGPYNGTVGIAVAFDGTGSSDPDGTVVQYDWDFGDGTLAPNAGSNPSHTYTTAGSYTVSLTVTDDGGLTNTANTTADIVDAAQDPIADPNGPYNGFEGLSVTFDGSASFDPDGGTITQYDWDFGDGNTGTGVAPTHTYATAGTYTVTLTVVDDEGAQSAPATTTAVIEVPPDNLPPVADPNGPYTGIVGVPITFDGSASDDPDGDIVRYDWDFGDGNTASDAGPTPTHTYAAAGSYTVTLTVTDDGGAVASETTLAEIARDSGGNGGCTTGSREVLDPTLPLLLLIAVLYLARRRAS